MGYTNKSLLGVFLFLVGCDEGNRDIASYDGTPTTLRDNIGVGTTITTTRSVSAKFLEAVKSGNLEQVQSYLDQNIDVNTQDEYGWTALMFASDDLNILKTEGKVKQNKDKT